MWDAETWAGNRSLVEEYRITSTAFSPNGQQLVSGSKDGTVRLWDITPEKSARNSSIGPSLTRRAVFYTDWVSSVAFTSDGAIIIFKL